MNSIESIRNKVRKLYETDPHIHVNIKMSHPKINAENRPAEIKGVYPHIFRLEENDSGHTRIHSVQYTDILIGNISISELEAK